jgi:very-short-patch-repair endonuclease
MRKNPTPPEKIMWELLRRKSLGVRFRRQHPVESYIPDFYCHDLNLAVEIDGKTYHSSAAAQRHDAVRDELMRQKRLQVIRFAASRVFHDAEGVFAEIKRLSDEFFSIENAEWVDAGALKVRDLVFSGLKRMAVRIAGLYDQKTNEQVYDLEIEKAYSYSTEVCMVHNCGSGGSLSE